eukprot:UC4_evm7s179
MASPNPSPSIPVCSVFAGLAIDQQEQKENQGQDQQGPSLEDIAACLATLYSTPDVSAKEEKKIAKTLKFREKGKKKNTPSGEGATDSAKKKKKEEKEKKRKEIAAAAADNKSSWTYSPPPKGEKKNTAVLCPEYRPREVEDAWYAWWLKLGIYKPEYQRQEREKKLADAGAKDHDDRHFTIIIPPPNVTGSLHVGHALTNAIEDSLTRWNRMKGKITLWNPGCDHAGIATQSVVEKQLWKHEKKSRHDLGREAFLGKVWEWKETKEKRIYEQIQGLAASCDWDRAKFTMDPQLSRACEECFVRMHEKGIIYRDNRLVNWSCKLNSAISDMEVDKTEIDGTTTFSVPGYDRKIEFGFMYHFAYKVKGASGPDDEIVVATTRPETMLGDVAVAVHPDDGRWKHLHGKTLVHPFFPDREVKIITDTYVDISLGTGAVKITPAHDENDYKMGKRHNLPFITIIDTNGNMINCAEFTGMKRYDCRDAVREALKAKGLFRKQESKSMVVPICSRSKDIIEPLIVPQWFCNCIDMAKDALNLVKTGELRLIPKSFESVWSKFLKSAAGLIEGEEARPWCISRQLWWGHQIPAYFIDVNDPSVPKGQDSDSDYWVSARSEEEAINKAAAKFKVSADKIKVTRDPDVLDTWFSSGLFPISIFGWPNSNPELESFYPGSLLETGHDIIFFWVARMVMMCRWCTGTYEGDKWIPGKVPFRDVYLHGIVRDFYGRKMSKSLGNVIDPMDIRYGIKLQAMHDLLRQGNLDEKEILRAEADQKKQFGDTDGIPECGSDALRFALCEFSTADGMSVNLDVKRVSGYRKFCNKIWNAIKFVDMVIGDKFVPLPTQTTPEGASVLDKWILSRMDHAIATAESGFKTYNFPKITGAIHSFWKHDICDIFLECGKAVTLGTDEAAKETFRQVLYTAIENGLRLVAPFMPCIAEELWQHLPRRHANAPVSVHVADYPTIQGYRDEKLEAEIALVFGDNSILNNIRSVRMNYRLNKAVNPKIFLVGLNFNTKPYIDFLAKLGNASEISAVDASEVPSGCVMALSSACEVHVHLAGHIDVVKEKAALDKSLLKKQKALDASIAKITGPGFSKMPLDKQEAEKEKSASLSSEVDAINKQIEALKQFA